MAKKKNKKQKQQAKVKREKMKRKPSQNRTFQRASWIKFQNYLVNTSNVAYVQKTSRGIRFVVAEDDTLHFDLQEYPEIKQFEDQLGETALEDAINVVFGWVMQTLIDCNAGILDVDAYIRQLQIKSQEPVQLPEGEAAPAQEGQAA